MNEMVQIRSVKQYFNDFIVADLKDKKSASEVDLITIKEKMLKAFKEEIFGQIAFKLGDAAKTMSKDDLAKIDVVNNILVQEVRKWRRICILCSEHGLGNFFQLTDIQRVLEEENDPDEVITVNSSKDPNAEVDVTDEIDPENPPVILEKETADDQDQEA